MPRATPMTPTTTTAGSDSAADAAVARDLVKWLQQQCLPLVGVTVGLVTIHLAYVPPVSRAEDFKMPTPSDSAGLYAQYGGEALAEAMKSGTTLIEDDDDVPAVNS